MTEMQAIKNYARFSPAQIRTVIQQLFTLMETYDCPQMVKATHQEIRMARIALYARKKNS